MDTLRAITTIKTFGAEHHAQLEAETRVVRLLRSIYRSGTNGIFSSTSSQAISRGATLALLWIGTLLVLEQTITPGELMSFYALMGYLTGPVVVLIGANRTIQDALIAADRLFEILDLEPESGRGASAPLRAAGDIQVQRLQFRYGTRERVFEGLDLKFPAGSTTALVGESGSGKSTLAALLQGLYPVEQGQILFGPRDIRHIDPSALRRIVGVVPQRVDLLGTSVLQNIALGELTPDIDRATRICSELGLLEFVRSLPDGFHTRLGEGGIGLSGGQRQRIAIARALYREPDVLILDEATSALDSVAEQHVSRVLQRLRAEGRTVIIIAHRLATVRLADRIVVLGDGRVLEQGTERQLLDRRGAYWELWRNQVPPDLLARIAESRPSRDGRPRTPAVS